MNFSINKFNEANTSAPEEIHIESFDADVAIEKI